jgi:hypothetical protein
MFFFTADSAIVSLTMVTIWDLTTKKNKKSLPTDPIILRHATGKHIFFLALYKVSNIFNKNVILLVFSLPLA